MLVRILFRMETKIMPHRKYHSEGHVLIPALICALAGVGLSVGLSMMGYYAGVESWLRAWLEAKPIYLRDGYVWSQACEYGVAGVLSIGLALAVLDTPRILRRLLLGVIVFVLMLSGVLVLALWGVMWLPVMSLVAVGWTFLSVMIYAGQHLMPCERTVVTVVGKKETVRIELHHETVPLPVKKRKLEVASSEGEKYQPKPVDSPIKSADDPVHGES